MYVCMCVGAVHLVCVACVRWKRERERERAEGLH